MPSQVEVPPLPNTWPHISALVGQKDAYPSASTQANALTAASAAALDEGNLLSTLKSNTAELSNRVTNVLRDWVNSVTKTPVQSIFVGSPSVTLDRFIAHLVDLFRVLKVETTLVVYVLVYVRRLMDSETFIVSWKNVWRLILAGSLTTLKYQTDESFYNSDFAGMIGLPVSDINALEMGFLDLVRFDLFVSDDEFLSMAWCLLQTAPHVAG